MSVCGYVYMYESIYVRMYVCGCVYSMEGMVYKKIDSLQVLRLPPTDQKHAD